ncbi:MAG: TolC family protein, partial [Planctomycetes bacterium]|nr:TolC family protein [Planctomycetota bacterium]
MLLRQCFALLLTLVVALSGCQAHVALGPAKRSEATIAVSSKLQPVDRAVAAATLRAASQTDVPSADAELVRAAQPSDRHATELDGVETAAHETDSAAESLLVSPLPDQPPVPLPEASPPADETFPINLGTALELAGANNLQIALATERVREAVARLEGAEVLWIPTLNAGVAYNTHTGRIQDTRGGVIEVNRESVFVGGGAKLDDVPLNGGAGGPPRLFVDISPADIYFEPLAARQSAAAAQADETAVFNDTLLEVTARYLELLQAQSQIAIADEAIGYAEELARITEEFAEGGIGLRADAERAQAELSDRRRERLEAEERLRVVSAELARLLRLSPSVVLFAVDAQPVPLA